MSCDSRAAINGIFAGVDGKWAHVFSACIFFSDNKCQSNSIMNGNFFFSLEYTFSKCVLCNLDSLVPVRLFKWLALL